jgi:hypothetical protein
LFYVANSAGRGGSQGRSVPSVFRPGRMRGHGVCPGDPSSVQGAGGRGTATGEPPQMGTSGQWVPAPWFPPHTSPRGAGRVGCRLWGVGAAFWFWCPRCPVRPALRTSVFGGCLESHSQKPVETRWDGIKHQGGTGLVTATRHVPAKCARAGAPRASGHPRKCPGSTPTPTTSHYHYIEPANANTNTNT